MEPDIELVNTLFTVKLKNLISLSLPCNVFKIQPDIELVNALFTVK